MRYSTHLLAITAWLIFAFLALPIIVVIIASFTSRGYLSFPPSGWSLRWYVEFLGSAQWLRVFGFSVLLGIVTSVITTLSAFLAAIVTVRQPFPGRGAYELGMVSSLLFPHAGVAVVMLGVALALGVRGSTLGILLAHCVIALPFAYRPIVTAMRKMDLSLEEAALSLGAKPPLVFRRITLPVLRPGIVTALLFSFIISFDEVTATMFLIGPGLSTLPVQIFTEVQESASPVIAAISATLIFLTIGLVLLLERLVGLEFFAENRT